MILLVGNFLSKHGLNPTAIEDLAIILSARYEIQSCSNKKQPFFRMTDMVMTIICNWKKYSLIIIDVFSTHAFIFSCVIISLAKLFKIPYFPVLRGGYLPGRHKKNPRIFNFLFSNARTIISPSNYLKDYFENNRISIKIIPNYIDLEKYCFKKRKKIRPHLLWVRSIDRIYNPLMAIYVLDKIRKLYPDARLCMVGPVKDKIIMKKITKIICKLSLQDHVIFSGKLSKIEWAKLSEKYDIFINTTDYDNNPITLLEAKALGLPIISTNVGGVPYLITDGVSGLLVDQNDSDQMAEKINKLISGKINGEILTINSLKEVSKFDKKNIIEKWYQVIDNVIK